MRRRATIGLLVFLAVMVTLVFIIRGPGRYFAGTNVRADMSCTISHCNRNTDDMKWRLTGLNNH